MSDGTLILLAGALLALGIGATLVAGRLRVPGLVLFLVISIGMWAYLQMSLNAIWEQEAEPLEGHEAPPVRDDMPPTVPSGS